MEHQLKPLPYALDALEPHMSAETLQYHHGRHHKKYVQTLNRLIQDTEFEESPLEQIIENAGNGSLFNNAAQVWNHDFFWSCMSPDGGGKPSGELGQAIESSFGDFEDFKARFVEAAKGIFGSGWAWLVRTGPQILSIETTNDAENPLAHGSIALLTCDMWEHAYYIDRRNDKASYLNAFWNLVDWEAVARRYHASRPD